MKVISSGLQCRVSSRSGHVAVSSLFQEDALPADSLVAAGRPLEGVHRGRRDLKSAIIVDPCGR